VKRAAARFNPPPTAPASTRPRRKTKSKPRQDLESASPAPAPRSPPDLTELRNALAARGLALESRDAFYHEVLRQVPTLEPLTRSQAMLEATQSNRDHTPSGRLAAELAFSDVVRATKVGVA
jgi:hypothetical protein